MIQVVNWSVQNVWGSHLLQRRMSSSSLCWCGWKVNMKQVNERRIIEDGDFMPSSQLLFHLRSVLFPPIRVGLSQLISYLFAGSYSVWVQSVPKLWSFWCRPNKWTLVVLAHMQVNPDVLHYTLNDMEESVAIMSSKNQKGSWEIDSKEERVMKNVEKVLMWRFEWFPRSFIVISPQR